MSNVTTASLPAGQANKLAVLLDALGGVADLRCRAGFLAWLAGAAFGVADVLAGGGAFELAQAELDGITVPATTADTVCMLSAVGDAQSARRGGGPPG